MLRAQALLRDSLRKNFPQLSALVRFRYPDFVYRRTVEGLGDQIPVFVFHRIDPEGFEEKLRFLAANGYRTLRAAEFYEALAGTKKLPARAVVLTFDDGLRSLWTVGHPLLEKYGQVAIVFVAPGLVPEEFAPPSRQREDVLGDTSLSPSQPLASWGQLKSMVEAGTAEVQSHSWMHDCVFVSPRIVGFVSPWTDRSLLSPVGMIALREGAKESLMRSAPLGTPIYEAMPRLAAPRRYLDDEEIRAACVELVAEQGGRAFFNRRGWRRRLMKRAEHANGWRQAYEPQAEMEHAVRSDLAEARRHIEDRLGSQVLQLCYPWFSGSDRSMQLSKQAGYRANYWGILAGRRTNRPGDDPFRIARLAEHFIFRLPGEGRKPLAEVLFRHWGAHAAPFMGRVRGSFDRLGASR